MRSSICLLVAIGFLCVFVAAESKSEAWQKAVRSLKNLPDFTTESLKSLAASPRNYSIFIFITTEGKDIPCPTCKDVSSEFSLVRQTYLKKLGEANPSNSATFLENPIMFGRCDVRKCYDLVMQVRLSAIPSVFFTGPRESTKSGDAHFEAMPDAVEASAEQIASYVSSKSGFKITLDRLFYKQIAAAVGTIICLAFGYFYVIPFLRTVTISHWVWFLICMAAYGLSMVGFVFNAINNPPWNYRNPQTGQMMYIYPSSRHQFGQEGYLMAGLLTGLAVLTVLFVVIPLSMKNVWMQRVSVLIIGTAWYYAFWTLFSVFKMKNGYYPFNVDLPQLANDFFLSIVRLFRRR